jgi:hypothetical protein
MRSPRTEGKTRNERLSNLRKGQSPRDHPNPLLQLRAVGDNAAMETEQPRADPPKRKRRWFQFSLRTLLVITTIVAVQCAVCLPILREWQKTSTSEVFIRKPMSGDWVCEKVTVGGVIHLKHLIQRGGGERASEMQ